MRYGIKLFLRGVTFFEGGASSEAGTPNYSGFNHYQTGSTATTTHAQIKYLFIGVSC